MKNNRQIGLDGRVFLSDCLSDGIFFIYSIILSGCFGAAGDIMKLLGKSSHSMDTLTNGLVICDLVCSLSMIVVTYYVYFMHCGENIPRLGTRPLIYLEYLRLGYYGVLAYDVLFRFAEDLQDGSQIPAAIPVFYFFYFVWILCCMCAAMYILTVLHQNMIRRNYAQSFRWLSLIGLGSNALLPLVYFVTRIFWVRGAGDGFYSDGFCDFVRFALAPMFYAGVWFLFMSSIDQIDKVFSEVDAAIRDKRYRIEFDEEEKEKNHLLSQMKKGIKSGKDRKSGAKKKTREKAAAKKTAASASPVTASAEPADRNTAVSAPSEPEREEPIPTEKVFPDPATLPEKTGTESEPEEELSIERILAAVNADTPAQEPEEEGDTAKKVRPKKKHRITSAEEETVTATASGKTAEEITAALFGTPESSEADADGKE